MVKKSAKTKKGEAMAILAKERVIIREPELMDELGKRGYGEKEDTYLLLSPEEALYLTEKKYAFEIKSSTGRKLTYEGIMRHFSKLDKDFPMKYFVFRDMRNRGFCVKTGFKFGAHFRIYARGDKPGRGHAIWLMHAIPEEYVCDMADISRAVRLSQNVRKKMFYAVVDKEGDITYYKIERMTP